VTVRDTKLVKLCTLGLIKKKSLFSLQISETGSGKVTPAAVQGDAKKTHECKKSSSAKLQIFSLILDFQPFLSCFAVLDKDIRTVEFTKVSYNDSGLFTQRANICQWSSKISNYVS